MIKFLIKLAIAGFIANATWRVGSAYLSHYKFEDAVRETAQFRGRKSDDELRERIGELAAEYDVPVAAEDLTMRTEGNHFLIDGSYTRKIDLFPGYAYQWPFTVKSDIFVDAVRRPGDARPR